MAFFPRVFANEFAPVFRLLDDYATQVATSNSRAPAYNRCAPRQRTFQPRFDVQENKESYELFGELPGIEQDDINIEFTDATTLSIKGRTTSTQEEGTRPTAVTESQPEPTQTAEDQAEKSAAAESDAEWDTVTKADSEAGSYHKATVEDENAAPAEAPQESEPAPAEQVTATQEPAPQGPKRWVSERTVGSFARTFSFPDRVDHENVKASLKNGILSIVVPKAAIPASRRINIE